MKKVLSVGLLALAAVLGAQSKASAWCTFNFGTGLNFGVQSGGCKMLWGLVETSPGPYMPVGGCCQGYPCPPAYGPQMQMLPETPLPLPSTDPNEKPKTGQLDLPVMPQANAGYYQYPQYGYWQYPQQGYIQNPVNQVNYPTVTPTGR